MDDKDYCICFFRGLAHSVHLYPIFGKGHLIDKDSTDELQSKVDAAEKALRELADFIESH